MDEQTVLTKAMKKAEKNGWSYPEWFASHGEISLGPNTYRTLIFGHDFCRALWGEEWVWIDYKEWDVLDQDIIKLRAYEYHLLRMIISPDPIKYLGEHLNG